MKVLVAAASRHNATREIAELISDELRTGGLEVDLRPADAVSDIADYHAVVLGSAVYMGKWLPDAKHFVETHGSALRTMPVWLFSSGPLGADDPKPHGDPADVPELLEATQARDHRIFAGKLDQGSLGLGERLIAKAVHAPEGDFRDLGAIIEWAGSIGQALVPAQTHLSGRRSR